MIIFNSLGSNYTWSFAWKTLQAKLQFRPHNKVKLLNQLTQRFGGEAILLAKGRDALEYILLSYNIGADDVVLTQAFACFALEEAIKRVGAKTVYFDLQADSLEADLTHIQQLQKKHQAKALILQYSLGSSLATKQFKQFCLKNNLLLIEDLAQSFGGKDWDEQKLGTYADAILLSFGRDKILDTVSGGAVILKKSPLKKINLTSQYLSNLELWKIATYPILTCFIRASYAIGLGKLLHLFLKKIQWFKNALYTFNQHYWPLPDFLIPLISQRLQTVHQQLKHRQQIAQIYWQTLQNIPQLTLLTKPKDLAYGSNLRFAFAVANPKILLDFLAKNHVYLADRWYRSAVDCGSSVCHSVYQAGSCPQAEKLAKTIINLPTHQEITPAKAEKICQLIESFYV